MKKFRSLLAVLLICAMVAGCTPSGSGETTAPAVSHSLSVGFGRTDITPTEPVPLGGYNNQSTRISTEVLDPLYATCLAFTDENGSTVLLYHLDLTGCTADIMLYARSEIAKATEIPMHNIMVSATHMHSGPYLKSESIAVQNYIDMLYQRMVEAAKAALADRKSATAYTASTKLTGFNFVRHYIMSDGSITGNGFGSLAGLTNVGHVSEADNTMQLIKFVREGGEDVVMVNWQGHPHRVGNTTQITSDIVGVMRSYMEENIGCKFAYFSGASGNVNNNSRIKSEMAADNYLTHGQLMGQHAIDALKNCETKEAGIVQIQHNVYKGISKKNSKLTIDINMYAFSIGDIGFICAPYEMFDTNGMYIKDNSPFDMTFVVTYANFGLSYIPSAPTYHYEKAEEPYEVGACKFVEGTGELLAEEYVSMLKSIYETRK